MNWIQKTVVLSLVALTLPLCCCRSGIAQDLLNAADQQRLRLALIKNTEDRLAEQEKQLDELRSTQLKLKQSLSKLLSAGGIEKEKEKAEDPKTELYDRLETYLSGTKWTGNFLMDGKDGLIKERYEILSAKKSEFGDKWNLVARIKYGDHDATLPLPPMDIKFAGKTPVITVDGLFFPGFGTFDARVVIRKGKYAGTWQHGEVGGHLFGTIEKMTDEEIQAVKTLLKKQKID